MSLAKGKAIFTSVFFSKLPNQGSKDITDWINLDILTLLSFISVDILLAKAFLILVVCLVVKNNSCGNSSSLIFFLFNLIIVAGLFFAADVTLFNYVIVNLTLAS